MKKLDWQYLCPQNKRKVMTCKQNRKVFPLEIGQVWHTHPLPHTIETFKKVSYLKIGQISTPPPHTQLILKLVLSK